MLGRTPGSAIVVWSYLCPKIVTKMIVPDIEAAQAYLNSGPAEHLADRIIQGMPWFCDQVGIDFHNWSRDILAATGFPKASVLCLVGSAANGFSLSPEKAGAPFRMLQPDIKPSDLDFCLVDPSLFVQAWNSMIREDHLVGLHLRNDSVRGRVYWGRIEQNEIPRDQRAIMRKLIDAIRRTPEYRGYPASIRLYRRHEDLQGYTVWCLAKLKKAIEQ